MIRYLARSLRRQVTGSRTLFLLSVAGVALGVASVVAIQTLNQGALQAFDGSVRAVSGQADLNVVGTTPAFPESLLVRVLADPAVQGAWPLVRVDAAVRDRLGLLLDVVGVDVFAPVRFPIRDAEGAAPDRQSVARAVTDPGWTAVTPELAREMGWAVGDTVVVGSGSRSADLVIGALVDFRRLEPLAPRNLAVMDIAQAQHFLARRGLIHQIDIQLTPGADPAAVVARLQSALGSGVRVRTPEQRSQDAKGLLAAFRLNLTALSLISVLVGVFLVLTSVRASLARRRTEFGLLRSLGTSRRQVLVLIVVETAVLGLLGVTAGVPLGYWVARQNLAAVSGTLTTIYVLEAIETLPLTWPVAAIGLGVGLAGSCLGALLPAWGMVRRDTLSLLAPLARYERMNRTTGPLAWAAIGLGAAATAWFFLDGTGRRSGGFVYAGMMMLVLPLVVPLVVGRLSGWARPRSLGPGLGLRNLRARLQTSSFAVAALGVTVSMVVGVTILVGSFRQTLVSWLDVTIRADVYISTESWVRAGNEALLEPELLDEFRAREGVAAVEEQRRLQVRPRDGGPPIWVNGVRFGGAGAVRLTDRLPLASGRPDSVVARLARGQVLIGEPLARKRSLAAGDTLWLAGPDGPVDLVVAGVTYDYTSEGGTAILLMETLRRHFRTGSPNNAALFLAAGRDPEAEVAALKARYASKPLVFRSNHTLRREIMAIFDQTFAVTGTLRTLALLTAICGISLTLLVQARERAAELALLRSLGATRRQVFGLFLGEGATMGTIGLALGVVGGIGLAALLILVINREYFGWTIQPTWPALAIVRQLAVVLAATVLAAVVPALKAGLAGAHQLSRDDL